MRVLISAEGKHTANHPFTHRMMVDLRSTLIDFTGMQNSAVDPSSLTDPTVKRVEWGPVVINAEHREAGVITRIDGSRQTFFDKNVLTPYLDAFEQRMFDLAHEQAEFEAAQQFDQAFDEAHGVDRLRDHVLASREEETQTSEPEAAPIAEPAPEPPAEPHPADPVNDAKHGIRRPSPGVRIFDPDGTQGQS